MSMDEDRVCEMMKGRCFLDLRANCDTNFMSLREC